MSVVFMKQDEYQSPIDEIFEIGFENIAGFSSFSTDEFFGQYINKEIVGPDNKLYVIHSIMKDVLSAKFYAFCKELIDPQEL